MRDSVLIVGSLEEGRLESSYDRAFRRSGWDSVRWDPQAALKRSVRGGAFGRALSEFVGIDPWLKKANLDLLTLVWEEKPRMVLVVATTGIRPGTLAQIESFPERPRLYTVFPDSLDSLTADRINCLPLFDRVFVVSPSWVGSVQKMGAREVDYLPFAADPDLHHPRTVHGAPDVEVGFIGRWSPDRERFLDELTDYDLRIWGGPNWKNRTRRESPLPSRWAGEEVNGDAFADACTRTKIMINLIGPDGWPGPNMRTFELPACGAFPLSTRTDPILDLFEEGKNIECFGSSTEAREKIDRYLSDEESRARVASDAYDAVIAGGHTYEDRARHLISLCAGE